MLLRPRRAAPYLAGFLLLATASAQNGGEPGGASVVDDPGGSPLLDEMEAGTGSITLQLGVFDQADSGDGNPFLDESLTIIEPIVIYDYDVSDDFGFSVELSYDMVTSASIDRLSNFPDQSGASRDDYIGGDFAARHRLPGGSQFNWHAGYSDEYDYDSIGLGASLAWQPDGADATVSVGIDGYHDTIRVIRFDGTEEGDDTRDSVTINASWYQILTPTMHGEFGTSVAFQTGFLETPYNAVVLEDPLVAPNPNLDNMARGTEFSEELPDDRLRVAVYGKVRGQLGEGRAWELDSRVYGDDWDIFSLSVEPAYILPLIRDQLYLEASYRFYVQSASKYFEETLAVPDPLSEFRTQDSDLGDFSSNAVGLDLNWLKSPRSAFRLGVNYSLRSDGLDHIFGYLAWTRSF